MSARLLQTKTWIQLLGGFIVGNNSKFQPLCPGHKHLEEGTSCLKQFCAWGNLRCVKRIQCRPGISDQYISERQSLAWSFGDLSDASSLGWLRRGVSRLFTSPGTRYNHFSSRPPWEYRTSLHKRNCWLKNALFKGTLP